MPVVKEKVVVVSFLFKPSSLFSFDLHFVAFSSSSCCGGSGAGVEVVVVVADVVLVVVDILEIEPVRTQNTPVPVWYSYQVYTYEDFTKISLENSEFWPIWTRR